MKRSALRGFLRWVALTAVPLAGCGGGGGGGGGLVDGATVDMVGPTDMLDMSIPQAFDMSGDMVDMCLGLSPVRKEVPRAADAGAPNCQTECPPPPMNYFGGSSCKVATSDAGTSQLECTYFACSFGRRPAGLIAESSPAASALGSFLARAAQLEAASVVAFRRLGGELSTHHAPSELIARTAAAAKDEARHAGIMHALAVRHGTHPKAIDFLPIAARTLEDILIENAVEGCVNEAWGAVLATWQAENASDRNIRAAMRSIVADEESHAELAFQIAVWGDSQLTPASRERLHVARSTALAALKQSLETAPPEGLTMVTGLPSPADSLRLFRAAKQSIWS